MFSWSLPHSLTLTRALLIARSQAPALAVIVPASMLAAKGEQALAVVHKVADPAFAIADKAMEASTKAFEVAALAKGSMDDKKVKEAEKEMKKAEKAIEKIKARFR
jgi:hypothetical protein